MILTILIIFVLINVLPALYFGKKYFNLKRISQRIKILKDCLTL